MTKCLLSLTVLPKIIDQKFLANNEKNELAVPLVGWVPPSRPFLPRPPSMWKIRWRC